MNTEGIVLTPMQQKKEDLITSLMVDIEDSLTRYLTTSRETCYKAPAFGWSVEEHMYMPIVAERLRKKGYSVSSSVSFEVTDWKFGV